MYGGLADQQRDAAYAALSAPIGDPLQAQVPLPASESAQRNTNEFILGCLAQAQATHRPSGQVCNFFGNVVAAVVSHYNVVDGSRQHDNPHLHPFDIARPRHTGLLDQP